MMYSSNQIDDDDRDRRSEGGGQSLNLKSSESTLPNHYTMSEDKLHTV